MNDLISRQAAIDAALAFLVEYCGAAFDEDMQKMLCERLDALPPAQPERPKGKWMPHIEKSREYIGTVLVNVRYDYWLCDTCGYRVENGQPTYNFCPNCGADLRDKEAAE